MSFVGRDMSARRRILLAALIGVGTMLAGCSSGPSESAILERTDDATVAVGSFGFGESRLLAEVYSQALEAAGYPVERAFDLGPREFVGPALELGLVDLVPEYAGTASQFFGFGRVSPSPDATVTHEQLVRALGGRPITALAAAPAQTANAFVVTRGTAERYGLRTLSDLSPVGAQLTLGAAPECPSRPLCLLGLRRVYGLAFEEVVPLDAGGPVTLQALRNGDIDVALLFTSDPAISDEGLVELADDRGLQPAENVTPLVRSELLGRYGEGLAAVVDAVSMRLTTTALRDLNGRLARSDGAVAPIAAEWLATEATR
jgi:osmoprotectant transport system substrate-binding protein